MAFSMTLEELISEGEALQKPSFLLREQLNDGGIVAYWGGLRGDMPEQMPPEVTAFGSRHHVMTIKEALFTELKLDKFCRFGPVGLSEYRYRDRQGNNSSYRIECDYRKKFADLKFTGVPLYATPALSFPPLPAVCLYGSERIGSWLQSFGLDRHEYWRVDYGHFGADNKLLFENYNRALMQRSPFGRSDWEVDVIVGGWHLDWGDDYYPPAGVQMLYLSLRDSEPWHEGWHCPMTHSFYNRARIS